MFERPQGGERAVLVHLDFPAEADREQLQEFRDLAISAGVEPVATVTGSRASPHPRYFGQGGNSIFGTAAAFTIHRIDRVAFGIAVAAKLLRLQSGIYPTAFFL